MLFCAREDSLSLLNHSRIRSLARLLACSQDGLTPLELAEKVIHGVDSYGWFRDALRLGF